MCVQNYFKIITLLLAFYLVSLHELDDHPAWQLLPQEDCGYGALSDRIVGGQEATLGQFPWIVRIGYKIKPAREKLFYLCAGSIINEWYIVTALHCSVGILGDTITSIRIGENFQNQDVDCQDGICAPPLQDIFIASVSKFEHYFGSVSVSYGDIALIRLSEPASFSDYARPICLPRGRIAERILEYLALGTNVEVAGWGYTSSVTSQSPDKLMYVSMPVVSLDICKKNFKTHKIDESQVCVGVGAGKDSCVGDSGGPLMKPIALDSPPKYFLLGLVSYGMRWCGIGAAIYTNVTFYMEWILNNVDP